MKAFLIWVSIPVEINITLLRTNTTKKIQMQQGSLINDLIKKINLKPDSLIVIENNKPVPIDDNLYNGQQLTIIEVSSGG